MLNVIDGVNYYLQFTLFWGSEATDVQSSLGSMNTSVLIPENIRKVEICSSLAYPFFHGSLIYRDGRYNSNFRKLMDMPIVYGRLVFAALNGSDVPGSDNVPEQLDGENLNEEVFITGFDTLDDSQSNYVDVKVNFISVDYLKFISNMKGVSTFNGSDGTTKPVAELLKDMFGSVGLGDKLDVDSIKMDVQVPYISTENDTLLNGLDYVYRKIFDSDFKTRNGKSYCRIVYDLQKAKYVLWSFDDVGTDKNLSSPDTNPMLKSRREMISVNSKIGSDAAAVDGKASFHSGGDQSVLFETLSDLKFVDYDYLKNEFTELDSKENGESFISHKDEMDPSTLSSSKLVFGNSQLFKDNRYERTFSTSRQNGSQYDVFTEAIFDTSFARAESYGSIGRRAGDSIVLSFVNSSGSIYDHLSGTYLITAVRSVYVSEGDVKAFRSTLDLYRPYCTKDSAKKYD